MRNADTIEPALAKISDGVRLQIGPELALTPSTVVGATNLPVIRLATRLGIWGAALLAPSTAFAQNGSPGVPWWWTSLLAPLLTGAFGVLVGYIAISFDAKKASNQELIKKRIFIYDQIAPHLNELYCFFLVRGNWKSLTPPAMIEKKRELDRTIYIYGPLFSQHVFIKYNYFTRSCFMTFRGPGVDAQLRAQTEYLRSQWGPKWNPAWDALFAPANEATNLETIARQYRELMTQLAVEIGAHSGRTLRSQLIGKFSILARPAAARRSHSHT